MIRVFLISSNRLLLEGLVAVVASRPEYFKLVGSAVSPEEAGSTLATSQAQVVLFDVDDSQGHIPVLIEEIKAQCNARILLLTGQSNGGLPDRVLALGACGLIERFTPPELLLRALEKVHEGQVWLSRATTGRIAIEQAHSGADTHPGAPLALLTARERKILAAVVHHGSESCKAIALKLHIGESTLRNHLTSIYAKLGVHNRNGLLVHAVEAGLTEHLACQPDQDGE